MGIRPFVAITQTLGSTSANIASSTLKGIIVGPCIQSEMDFSEKLNLSSAYGSLASILTDAGTAGKVVSAAGLLAGSSIQADSLSFGINNGLATVDLDGNYVSTIKSAAERHILKVDITTAGATTIAELLSKGAEDGDMLTVSFDNAGTVESETHKIRKFETVDNAGTMELYIYLWNEISSAAVDDTTELTLVEHKKLQNTNLSILAPLEVTLLDATSKSFTIDNSSNPSEGGFTCDLYVYSPVDNPDGITFSNRHVSTKKLTTLSNYTMVKNVYKVTDGDLYNFFDADRVDLSNNIFEVNEYNYVEKLGSPSKNNKLSYAMKLICKEVPGATMRVYVTESDTYTGYKKALGAITTSGLVYSVSVLTDDQSVLDEVVNMVASAGSPSVAKWKMGIIAPRTPFFSKTISLSDYTIVKNSGVDTYTIESTTGGFLAVGLSTEDNLFTGADLDVAEKTYYDGYGETYTSASIGKVVSVVTDKKIIVQPLIPNDNLVTKLAAQTAVLGGLNSFESLSSKMKQKAKDIDSKGIVSIFPDKFEVAEGDEEVLLPSYYLAAVTNGVMAHLPPQQGLSNLSMPSINRVIGSSFSFTDGELDELASAGILVFLQTDNSSDPYILRQLTTNMSGLETMEINKVRCLDYATIEFAGAIDGYIGKRNVSTENAIDLKDELKAAGTTMVDTTDILYLGPVITDYTIEDVSIPDTETDAINAVISVGTPTSLNKIRLSVSSGIKK